LHNVNEPIDAGFPDGEQMAPAAFVARLIEGQLREGDGLHEEFIGP
jgi:hypothetical protein